MSIFKLVSGGFFEVSESESSPTVVDIRRKYTGYKAIQAVEDFVVRFGLETYIGVTGDWLVYSVADQKVDVMSNVRFNTLFEVVP